MSAMKRVKEQGKARYLGISVDSEEAALAAIESGDYDCIQVSYNLLNRFAESRVFPLAEEQGIGVIIKDGLSTGRLTHKRQQVDDENLRSRIETQAKSAEEMGMTLSEYAIRFVLSHRAVSTIIVGTKNPAHLRDNLASMSRPDLTVSIRERERHG
jgi:aryl-alcohol dehydrogenase-like predicted oxidoreductase